MREVKINKDELRRTIQENRDKHRELFEKAIEGYRKAAIEFFNSQLDLAKAGKDFQTFFTEPIPQDHTYDYDVVLEMIYMEVDSYINLTQSEFKQYVKDDWGWKKEFMATSANYVGELT